MAAPTLFVNSLPASATNERLEEIFSEIGPVKQCFVVRDRDTEKCRGFGYVTYSMSEDAQRALKEIKEYDGQKLSVAVAKKKIKDKNKKAAKDAPAAPEKKVQKTKGIRKKLLKARLIIRNLSFKCTEDDLKQVCAEFGTVLEARIPLKPDGKMRGFAFVLYKNIIEAAKALNALNMKEIKGRPVAIDWAVPKDKFINMQQSLSSSSRNAEEASANTDGDSTDEDEEKKQTSPQKRTDTMKPAVKHTGKSESDDDEDAEDRDSDDEDVEEDNGADQEEEDGSSVDSDDEYDDLDVNDEDEDDESERKKMSKKTLCFDANDGRTVFIRNLSFETDEEDLEKVLLQYGELHYVKIVLHPDTEHSKGCAFAQFKSKEAADKCIAASQDEAENGGIRIQGRKLLVVIAVSREDAAKLKVDQKKVETGTRNLYLAREGLIRPGTKAAEGVPEADMAKRTRFEQIKRAKLRDIHVFVSKTRLCVHNLPKSVDNKKLRALCLQAVKGAKGARITECRVMYDKKPEKGQVMGHSLGYGFVQFQDHEHALGTLRYLNNNPNIFGSQKRPIVEFSLEDSRKLKIKEMRQQKSKMFSHGQPSKRGAEPRSQKPGGRKGTGKGGNKTQSSLEQTGKKGGKKAGIVELQKREGHYSGFQTTSEVEYIELENGKKRRKVLPLPSHQGPKIRKRDKRKRQAPPPKKPKPGSSRRECQRRQMEKPTQPRNQGVQTSKKTFKHRDRDHFESLVEQYKKKLMGTDRNVSIKKSKWFDS
ncbi:RNA-binding protein 28 [Pholidichthys leucotaenia]